MKAFNVPITIIEDSAFVNNFGDNGASIHFEAGGGLYCKRVHFSMDEEYISFNEDQL